MIKLAIVIIIIVITMFIGISIFLHKKDLYPYGSIFLVALLTNGMVPKQQPNFMKRC